MQARQTPHLPHRGHSRTHTRVHELADFNRKRRHNALRLKNRFADIIERYGHDFEDVGDVIDLETARVVVDNGHLSSMEGELDPAYDLCAWGEDEEGEEAERDRGFVVDEEEIDELGVDMLTEGEIGAMRGGLTKTDDEGDGGLHENGDQQVITRKADMDVALVTLPTAELSPISLGEQKKFEAPLFPQLEMAVNSMTSMLQQQMMAMLGQVLTPQKTNPQPMPESRQILPAPALPSLKRRFDGTTPSNSVEPDRIHTESPEPRMSSPKSYSPKKRRMSDAEAKREGQPKSALGRKLHSSPIRNQGTGTPPTTTHGASLWKTSKSMPARPQRSMTLRSPKVISQTRVESKSFPARPILKISQLLPDDDTSEDELSSFVKPRPVEVSAKKPLSPKGNALYRTSSKDNILKAASPKADARRILTPPAGHPKSSTPTASASTDNAQEPVSPNEHAPTKSSRKVISPELSSSTVREPSPRVVIIMGPDVISESVETDDGNVLACVVQSPPAKRGRRRKSKFLVSEQHKDTEFLLRTTVDELIDKSDVKPPQLLDANEDIFADENEGKSSNEPAIEEIAKTVPETTAQKIPKRRRRTGLDKLLAEAEQYTSMSQSVRDFMKARRRSEGKARIESPIAIESEALMTPQVTKSNLAISAEPRPENRRTSIGDHVIKNEDEPGETATVLPEATIDGPASIADTIILKDDPPPQREKATPLRQFSLKTTAASCGREGSRAVVFVPEAEIIPDSQEEEEADVVLDDKDVEVKAGMANWVEDLNNQLVTE
ncbi:hypothetical protein E2P81_ATG09450 [Venturia nashicola]|uniref:Uncharacterized protein n=1 Tax=Venturia nashicola TaxID=86259 RepID=A0A4Z1NMF7_9PEZI|nr:hypothetical protein E6O75_ATG09659 [Venturia nashicola]TLD25793.1 hypothetical protein E2P81_ATG09450 [Venturia nashicola]